MNLQLTLLLIHSTNNNHNNSTLQALSPTGATLFTTGALDGTSAGTPVTTSSGSHVLINTNPTLSTGLFAVFEKSAPGTTVLTFPTELSRFSAIGAYWNPVQGCVCVFLLLYCYCWNCIIAIEC